MKEELIIKELNKLFDNKWKSYKSSTLLKNTDGWDSLKQIQLVLLLEKIIKKKLSVQKILKIKPKIGTAVFWKNIDENGFPLESSHHEGTKIKKGLKYILTIWIRESSEDREVINVYGPRTMSSPMDNE